MERRKGIVEGEFGIPLSYEITEEMKRMCNLGEAVAAMGMEKGVEKGIVIGAEKNLLANLRSLMETLGFTAEQAMDALKVPAGERRKYADML